MPSTSTDQHAASAPTVLVADDDPVMRALMMEVLAQAGFNVLGATDGEDAIDMARQHRPKAIVIDLLMPKASGFQVVTALRKDRALRRVPVIVMSGLDDVGARVQALTAGANDFVVKPVAPVELVARVQAQLRIEDAHADGVDTRRDAWRRQVVRDQAFDIWFQPIVDLHNGCIVAQEALTRFHDGTPAWEAFHDSGAIETRVALEMAVLGQAIATARWLPPGLTLHLNISPLGAAEPALPALIEQAGRPCVVEITENEMFAAEDAQTLRSSLPIGCRIAADDVGVGYAGLAQILDVRPEIVKIDRAVVAWIDEDPARQALVAGLVQFGTATGCTLIAEGVERAEERNALVVLGVTLGQGHFFGRPAALHDRDEFVGSACAAAADHRTVVDSISARM